MMHLQCAVPDTRADVAGHPEGLFVREMRVRTTHGRPCPACGHYLTRPEPVKRYFADRVAPV
ncbi:MAG: hypothetical protein RBT36_10905, partial [Desulfobulbus sp.]|nr:hypothetical protein [Desulfobulbus sp.]